MWCPVVGGTLIQELSINGLSANISQLCISVSAVDKGNLMVGSYGPKTEAHVFTTPSEDAPSGMISRGHYNVKSLFTDDDKNKYLEWQWALEIKKDWA